VSLQVQLTAELVAGPAQISNSFFPSGTTTIPFGLQPNPKGYSVDTGPQRPLINSPNAFQTLSGIGSGQSVTQASTFYLRTGGLPFQVRLTYLGDATPKVMYVSGVLLLEPPQQSPLTLVEVQGGGQIEYWASGLQ
jgi:hypothetical protein